MYNKVEELREKLKKEYPVLNHITDKPQRSQLKVLSVEPVIVRPTISSNEIANMLHYSSKHKQIREVNFGPLPKRPIPFKLRVQEYEAETSLDCFMKHIATKSFEKYVTEKTPGFRKSAITEISLPEQRKKHKKKNHPRVLNVGNLEIFGQIEVKSKSPKFQESNLRALEKSIKKNIRSWCLQEKRRPNIEGQHIDHWTFRHKHN